MKVPDIMYTLCCVKQDSEKGEPRGTVDPNDEEQINRAVDLLYESPKWKRYARPTTRLENTLIPFFLIPV